MQKWCYEYQGAQNSWHCGVPAAKVGVDHQTDEPQADIHSVGVYNTETISHELHGNKKFHHYEWLT